MFSAFKQLLGLASKTDYNAILERGGVIIDVRTSYEYSSGHVNGSVNIPLSDLGVQLNRLSKDTPIITCCASGMRSGSAKTMLERNGFKEVYNGGNWHNLKQYGK